jgi:hypothetical protein
MSDIGQVTAGIAAALNGIAAGIMLSTVVGIVPMFLTLPYRGYVQSVQFLWPRYDPLMPILNLSALLLGGFSAVAVGPGPARPVLATGAVLLAVVVTISVTRNVPVNRFVSGLDADDQPANWSQIDPRRRWRFWNTLRTSIAVTAFAVNVTALTLLP